MYLKTCQQLAIHTENGPSIILLKYCFVANKSTCILTLRYSNPPQKISGRHQVEDELTEEDKHFVKKAVLDLQKKDTYGRTVVYHMISHYENGSWDNLRLLQLLICLGFKATDLEWTDYVDLAEKAGAVRITKFLRIFTGNHREMVMSSSTWRVCFESSVFLFLPDSTFFCRPILQTLR